jgi:hypothetical protein
MEAGDQHGIGMFGRYILFSGIGIACLASGVYFIEPLAKTVGERVLPYVLLAAIGFVVGATLHFFNVVPKRYIIPAGLSGWALAFLLLLFHALM